jgi:hypothetical protein
VSIDFCFCCTRKICSNHLFAVFSKNTLVGGIMGSNRITENVDILVNSI